MMSIQPTAIPDVLVISTRWFEDERGAFSEVYSAKRWRQLGITAEFVQDNHVLTHQVGTIRGLHFQRPPAAQAKLVRVVRGAVWDVVVDIRQGSPTFGQWVGVELSAANRLQMFVPKGFAHGYVTLEPESEFQYKVDDFYAPEQEGGIVWNDPALGISWPLPASGPVIAERDRLLPTLAELSPSFTWEAPR